MTPHTTLYRIYDADGVLLYVGVSSVGRAVARIKEYEAKPEFIRATYIRLEHFESRFDADTAEMEAIVREKPEWNVVTSRVRAYLSKLREEESQEMAMEAQVLEELKLAGGDKQP
jgi:hypothetical protein